MKSNKITHLSTSFAALFMAVFMIGSIDQSIEAQEKPKADEPTVVSTSPSDGEEDVARNIVIEITFSENMDSKSIENSTFTLKQGTETVEGTFEYSGNKGTFTTEGSLKAETEYTASLSGQNNQADYDYSNSENEFNEEESAENEFNEEENAENAENENAENSEYAVNSENSENADNKFNDEENHLETNDGEWTFTTGGNSDPVATVDLGSAADYVILAQTSIQNDESSEITGERGFDPEFKSSKDKEDKTAYWLNNEDVDKEEVKREKEATKREKEEGQEENEEVRSDANLENSDRRESSATATAGNANADNLDEALEDMISAYTDAAERTAIDFVDYDFHQSDDQSESTWNNDRDDQPEMNSDTESRWEDDDQNASAEENKVETEENYNAESEMDHNMDHNMDDNTAENELENNTAVSGVNSNTNESSVTLEPGIYKWNDSVEITSNITLSGNADDVWIFQISDGLTVDRDVEVTLGNGVVAENVIWQVAGDVNIGESSHFEGIILSLTGINMKNGASLNGRMLAQTDITLDENTIMEPQVFASARTSSNE